MTPLAFWLFCVAGPMIIGGLGGRIGWQLCMRHMDERLGQEYDRGWDNAVMATTFPSPAAQAIFERKRPRGRRPGKHASTQLPDPPKANGAASLPPASGGDNIGGKAS